MVSSPMKSGTGHNGLLAVALFGALNANTLKYLSDCAQNLELSAGVELFREGDQGDLFYLIVRGLVKITKTWILDPISLEEHVCKISQLGPGETLGEMAVFDMCPRSATARCIETTQVLAWHSTDLLGLFEVDVEQFAMLQMNIGREISRRLRVADQRLFELETAGSKSAKLW